MNLQLFGFNPANVLLQDAKTGSIPTEQGDLILTEFVKNSVVAQLAKPEHMTKPKKVFTYLAEGPGAYWVSESERIQTSKATWLQATMETRKLGVILPVSKEFLRYSVSSFFNEIKGAIAEAFYTKFDQAALFGNNSPYAPGISIWERITASDNKVAQGSNNANLYLDLNDLLALAEDGDNDPNGFTTTRKFRKDLRGSLDQNGIPIFNEPKGGATSIALGLPIGFASGKSWDYSKASLITGDWDYARYGILQGIEYAISEDATLTTLVDENGDPINLFERDMFALRATMHIGFMTLKEDAFGALLPDGGVVRHKINVSKSGGTVSVKTTPDCRASKGAVVSVDVSDVESGKEFKSIAVSSSGSSVSTTTVSAGERYSFVMPDGDVTVTVTVGV